MQFTQKNWRDCRGARAQIVGFFCGAWGKPTHRRGGGQRDEKGLETRHTHKCTHKCTRHAAQTKDKGEKEGRERERQDTCTREIQGRGGGHAADKKYIYNARVVWPRTMAAGT